VIFLVKIFYLPVKRWEEYKKLRLNALKTEKFAFSKNYSEEKDMGSSFWKSRLISKSVICAEKDKELIGMAVFVFNSNTAIKHIAEIFAVYVIPEFRGKGVSKKLFDFIVKESKKKKIIKIKLNVFENNISAKKFYLKQGFKIVGKCEKEFFVDGAYYGELMMEKFL